MISLRILHLSPIIRVLPLLLLVIGSIRIAVATTIATYSDDQCQHLLTSARAPNGYPNGRCTQLRSISPTFGSFAVIQEDLGCAVTIYGKDIVASSPCSAKVLEIAQVRSCYNSSWVNFSVDECTRAQSSLSVRPSSTIATTTSASSASSLSTVPRVTSTSSSGNGNNSNNSSSSNTNSNSPSGGSSSDVGPIAGGVVGGVVGLALVAVLAWFLFTRVGRSNQAQPQLQPPPSQPPADTKHFYSGAPLPGTGAEQKSSERMVGRAAQELSVSDLPIAEMASSRADGDPRVELP